jgi:hypothetical protein
MLLYKFLNIFFFAFHTVFTLFNIIGWVWERTRRLHLFTVSLTAFSWFILGIWYGFGYCPCTGWHWQVRCELGLYDMPSSYIKFLIDALTGLDTSVQFVNYATVIIFLMVFLMSVYLNVRDMRKKKP